MLYMYILYIILAHPPANIYPRINQATSAPQLRSPRTFMHTYIFTWRAQILCGCGVSLVGLGGMCGGLVYVRTKRLICSVVSFSKITSF